MSEARIFRGWRVVVGAGIGVGFGSAVFLSAAFPLIAAAVAAAYGWSQAEVAKGASLALLLQALGYAASGWLIDRYGSRAVGALSIVLFALSLAALALSGAVFWRYLLACGMIGLLAAGTNMVGYARAIAFWFDARRGLAFGVAAAFQAVGAVALPIVTQRVIAQASWPIAALAIAAFEIVVCLPIVLWLVEDDPASRGLKGEAPAQTPAPVDAPTSDGSGATFAKLAISFAFMGFSFYGIIANIAFILSAAGLSARDIAGIQAVSGLSVLFGRIGFGRMLDRFPAGFVGVTALAAAAAFSLAAANASIHPIAWAGAVVGGLSIGGESDLLPYMAARYWGRERVSRMLGLFLVVFVVGAGLGPIAVADASAALGGARMALIGLALLQIVPAALFLSLPAYPLRARV